MEDKLLQTVTDELCKHFNDPIDIECSYCEAAKAVIPIIRAETLKMVGEKMFDVYRTGFPYDKDDIIPGITKEDWEALNKLEVSNGH